MAPSAGVRGLGSIRRNGAECGGMGLSKMARLKRPPIQAAFSIESSRHRKPNSSKKPLRLRSATAVPLFSSAAQRRSSSPRSRPLSAHFGQPHSEGILKRWWTSQPVRHRRNAGLRASARPAARARRSSPGGSTCLRRLNRRSDSHACQQRPPVRARPCARRVRGSRKPRSTAASKARTSPCHGASLVDRMWLTKRPESGLSTISSERLQNVAVQDGILHGIVLPYQFRATNEPYDSRRQEWFGQVRMRTNAASWPVQFVPKLGGSQDYRCTHSRSCMDSADGGWRTGRTGYLDGSAENSKLNRYSAAHKLRCPLA